MKRPRWKLWLEYVVLLAGFAPVPLAAHFAPALPADWAWWALAAWFVYLVISRAVHWPSRDFWADLNKWAE